MGLARASYCLLGARLQRRLDLGWTLSLSLALSILPFSIYLSQYVFLSFFLSSARLNLIIQYLIVKAI